MSELVGLDHVSLSLEGPTLSMGVQSGSLVGIFGPAAAGKSALLRVITGREKPVEGKVEVRCDHHLAEGFTLGRRVHPLSLARRGRGPHSASVATEALLAARLWEVKNEALSQLSPSQVAACELLEVFTSDAPLLALDGQLDRLDPWTLSSVLAYVRRLKSRGAALVVATNRADLAHIFDALIVLDDNELRFAGSPEDLMRNAKSHELVVTAKDQPGVLALVAPFSVSVSEQADGIHLVADEGQEVAARLLAEGYGNVKFVIHRPPSLEDALLSLLR
ncbi:MAG TPA: ATP-binding cassette domain-containing protein [Fimbriimonas sp.]|nr:ATP-binding cassette domain-containing protein [Fimbriimonas sp.]